MKSHLPTRVFHRCLAVFVVFLVPTWASAEPSSDFTESSIPSADVSGPSPSPFRCIAQSFDTVIAPTLPRRWVAGNAAGPSPTWVIATSLPNSGPNVAFVDDPGTISDKHLDTPPIGAFGSTIQLTFRHNYALDPVGGGSNFFDGAVLEVSSPSIAGGAFTDITSPLVGGTFHVGGYNGTISTAFSSPLAGRMAWSQSSPGYINTVATIPNPGLTTFRFRMCSDSSGTGSGWRVDNVAITDGLCNGDPGGTPSPTPTPACTMLPPTTEGFNDITTLVPAGWFMQNNSQPGPGLTGWLQGISGAFTADSGGGSSYIAATFNNGSGTSTLSNWLLTPAMVMNDGAALSFETRTVTAPTYPDRLQVRLSTNGGSTNVGTGATDVGDFTTLLLDINPSYSVFVTAYPVAWRRHTVILHGMSFPFTGRFAFRYFVENGGPTGNNSDYIGIDSVVLSPGCSPGPGTPTPTPPPTPTPSASPPPLPTPTPIQTCQAAVTQSASQTITLGNSSSCNSGSPDFFHADTSYWRSFALAPLPPNFFRVINGVSIGIEKATANPNVGTQPVTVRFHAQTNGVFPAGAWTQFATTTVNVPNQTGTVFSVPMNSAIVPSNATRLIMEVFTPDGRSPINNSFVIGSNTAGQSAPGYISAPFCGLTTPTDLATIGHPNMHMVFNFNLTCLVGDPTPTPRPLNISGNLSYCPDPATIPVPNVVLSLTGSASNSTLSDANGNYIFSSVTEFGTYTVTPSKTALSSGAAGITTVDVIAVQRHYLNITLLPSGCRLTAADANGDSAISTVDVIAIQRFFLGLSTGLANVGKYQFTPASRTYPNLTSNQINQNYDTLVFGDVAAPFVSP